MLNNYKMNIDILPYPTNITWKIQWTNTSIKKIHIDPWQTLFSLSKPYYMKKIYLLPRTYFQIPILLLFWDGHRHKKEGPIISVKSFHQRPYVQNNATLNPRHGLMLSVRHHWTASCIQHLEAMDVHKRP